MYIHRATLRHLNMLFSLQYTWPVNLTLKKSGSQNFYISITLYFAIYIYLENFARKLIISRISFSLLSLYGTPYCPSILYLLTPNSFYGVNTSETSVHTNVRVRGRPRHLISYGWRHLRQFSHETSYTHTYTPILISSKFCTMYSSNISIAFFWSLFDKDIFFWK